MGMPTGHRFPHLEATQIPDEYDVAWAAGVYEGEGWCLSNKRPSGTYSLQVSIGQKDDWMLKRLRNLFGGRVSISKNKLGETFVWSVHSSRACDFLELIYPWLSPRRMKQIDKVLSKTTFTIDPS